MSAGEVRVNAETDEHGSNTRYCGNETQQVADDAIASSQGSSCSGPQARSEAGQRTVGGKVQLDVRRENRGRRRDEGI